MNKDSDSEISLILNQYGMEDQHGASGKLLRRLKAGELPLKRQLVTNEDYLAPVPQLAYDPVEVAILQAEQAERRELERHFFLGLGAAWVKSRAERPSVSEVN